MLSRAPTFLVLAALLVAGCSGDPPASKTQGEPLVGEDSFDDYALEDTAPSFGVIRGVVVDPRLAPLAGVVIELEGGPNTTTSDTGIFAFKDVAPGTHFIRATLAGYDSAQASAEVVADVAEPPLVKILLRRIPGTEPRAVGQVWDGLMMCSLRIPAAGFNDGCGVFSNLVLNSTQRVEVLYEGTGIQWWQGELIWDATGATTERLCMRVQGADTLAGGEACGPNPVVQAMDRALVEANDLEAQESIELVAYPDHLAAGVSGNLVLQQPFKFVHYVFYNFVPPTGWTFTADGEPEIP
jgi:hypothetical protein